MSVEKNPSTALSHEAEVGVKWKVKPRMACKPSAHLRVLVASVVVEHHTANPSSLTRTHSISGNTSSKTVRYFVDEFNLQENILVTQLLL